ncbi:MAG: formate dehydrogenase accessory sulfurtransferase FdhD [Gemmatimonadota bacterium]
MRGQGSPIRAVRVLRFRDGKGSQARDALAVEEPLEVRVAWREEGRRRSEPFSVTMRTPGDDFELVAGLLLGEGVVRSAAELQEITYCRSGEGTQDYNVVEARLASGVTFDAERMRRNLYATSSCGICGRASLEGAELLGCGPVGGDDVRVSPETLLRLPDVLYEDQGTFHRTGGLHAAGLFPLAGEGKELREDVGRHNAVDKVLGHALLQGRVPAADRILVVSGRLSFEIVQKAVMAGVPVLVAVGAPSSLAVELAERSRQTLVGFVRQGGFNVYSAPERIG